MRRAVDGRDAMLHGKASRARSFKIPKAQPNDALALPYEPTDAVLEQLRTLAPGWARQSLLAHYREWSRGKQPANNPHGAFLGWVKRFTKDKAIA